MKITMKQGWLVKTKFNSPHGPDIWEFKEHDPGYAPEAWDCIRAEHVSGEIKRIMYFETDNFVIGDQEQ